MNKPCAALLLLAACTIAAEPLPPVPDKQPEPPFAPPDPATHLRMLFPGFTVRELPVRLTALNNVEYAHDGRLFAGGYDGRFHLLRDTDNDGLEDKVDTFSPETSANYPLGMAVKGGEPYAVLTDEVVRWRDTNGDGLPDKRETVVKGFDDPAMVAAPYLSHRRVDSSMGIAFAPDGTLFLSMGNGGYNNPYWKDPAGVAHYSPDKRRGCLLRFGPDGKAEQIASGLRYIMSLQFDRHGSLFGTDQEGATWVPNGNPFDELLHLQPGRHYGFPPHHPRELPGVVDEPSTWDYTPQHQSTCGFRFNRGLQQTGRFGPGIWADDAIVTGEARGKLWRTRLAKTAAGYVARTQLIGSVPLLAVDCTISPRGELVVCCHTGKPDWGNGPKGEGRIFKISLSGHSEPQPVLAWPASETKTIIAYDRALDPTSWADLASRVKIEAGRYAAAGDPLETMRPGYAVVAMQQKQKRQTVAVKDSYLGEAQRSVVIEHAPRASAIGHAVELSAPAGRVIPARVPEAQASLDHDLSGVAAAWVGSGAPWNGWMPHPDFVAAREFTHGSATHDEMWEKISTPGWLTLRGQLDLWRMLVPATQPLSLLPWTPEPETVTLTFISDASLEVTAAGGEVVRHRENKTTLTFTGARENVWPEFTLKLATPARRLEVGFTTTRDSITRPLASRRFLVPFARPAPPDDLTRGIPEITGGDWSAGHALFLGKAACATCHLIRGEGVNVGPDLSNLIHSDFASLLKNIVEPSASINPDAVGYTVVLRDASVIIGTRQRETADELHIAQPGGAVAKLKKADIIKTEPMTVSLMPAGLDKILSKDELRDLMTFLLKASPN